MEDFWKTRKLTPEEIESWINPEAIKSFLKSLDADR